MRIAQCTCEAPVRTCADVLLFIQENTLVSPAFIVINSEFISSSLKDEAAADNKAVTLQTSE